jgi:TetR/AcrR family tetracycline transcriptional repressor
MNDESKRRRDLDRLEHRRRLINGRFERQHARINERFDRKQQQLSQQLNHKQEEIITTALQLLDADGLTNLSLRKLAMKLDMQAPGLYWHFKNKGILIEYLAEQILQEAFSRLEVRQADEPWQDWLRMVMNDLRRAMLNHTDGARVVAGARLYPAVTLGKLFELSVSSLRSAGFEILAARRIMMTIITYTFGFVIEEQSAPNSDELEKAQLSGVLKDYPITMEAMDAAQRANLSSEDEFNAGLQLILQGAQAAQ